MIKDSRLSHDIHWQLDTIAQQAITALFCFRSFQQLDSGHGKAKNVRSNHLTLNSGGGEDGYKLFRNQTLFT